LKYKAAGELASSLSLFHALAHIGLEKITTAQPNIIIETHTPHLHLRGLLKPELNDGSCAIPSCVKHP
jgi:hypothetical protein